MKKILSFCSILLFVPFMVFAGPTNPVTPGTLAVTMDTNNILIGTSTNIFTANSNLLNQSVAPSVSTNFPNIVVQTNAYIDGTNYIGTNGIAIYDYGNGSLAVSTNLTILGDTVTFVLGDSGFGFFNDDEMFGIGDTIDVLFPLEIDKTQGNRLTGTDGLTLAHDISYAFRNSLTYEVILGDFSGVDSQVGTAAETYLINCNVTGIFSLTNNLPQELIVGLDGATPARYPTIGFTKYDSSTNTVTITNTIGTIGMATSYTLSNQWQTIVLKPIGTNWIILSHYP